MVNMNNNEIEAVKKFYQNFSVSATKILYGSLDREIYKKFDMVTETIYSIENYEGLKENNVFYMLDYADGIVASSIALLIPEELIAEITDVMTGGSGEEAYKGVLSELETNSFSELLRRIFKDVENNYKRIYNGDLAFNAKATFLLKEAPEYKDQFANMDFDIVIELVLKINDKKEYVIKLLQKTQNIKQVISSLKLLSSGGGANGLEFDAIDIKHLSDVKINITAELGRAQVPMKYALELVRGSIVELDTIDNSDIKVFANGVEVAKAQIVVLEDNFGLRITKIITPEERLNSI